MRQRIANVLFAMRELRHVTREFLPQRQRRGVLQMRAANLDDGVKVLCLPRQRAAQFFNRREQAADNRSDCSYMHRRGKDIVRRLAAIHIIVRMHQPALAAFATEQLAGAIRQHLVDIHVGLRARTGLPHDERKFNGVLSCNHLVSGTPDGVGFELILQAQRMVNACRGPLDLRQRMNDLARLLFTGNIEVLQ